MAELSLQCGEEALCHGVVICRTHRSHRGQDAGLAELSTERERGELSQYLSIRYTERLAEAGAVTSVGSKGDSYDNALAETMIGLYKTELIRRRSPWKGIDDVEYATLEWVDWFNHRRLHSELGYMPPAEFEATYDREEATITATDSDNRASGEPGAVHGPPPCVATTRSVRV